ncbi:MAG: DUF1059 domain-containing protein [Actinomycetota bacterium]|nr:DUF1059 domain-containing protein [Actinomycetota bacterium]
MKKFACGDVVPGCDASWVCTTEEDLMSQVARHARSVHGVTDFSSVVDHVRSNTRDVD